MTISTRFDICSSGKVKSDERYPNRVASFGPNGAYMKFLKPNLPWTDNTLFLGNFCGFLRFIVWSNSGHFWGVYQSNYCTLLFSFVYKMYLNIAFYLYRKQIKSKLGNKLYFWMILICVHLNHLGLSECCTWSLNRIKLIWWTICAFGYWSLISDPYLNKVG